MALESLQLLRITKKDNSVLVVFFIMSPGFFGVFPPSLPSVVRKERMDS